MPLAMQRHLADLIFAATTASLGVITITLSTIALLTPKGFIDLVLLAVSVPTLLVSILALAYFLRTLPLQSKAAH
jgi:hypothetical protein